MADAGLIDGGDWYAAVEGWSADDEARGFRAAPLEDRAELRYVKVIAWQPYTDDEGTPQVRSWLSGIQPIASDRWHDSCQTHFINHYRQGLPPKGREMRVA
ncbi:hypothetical protein [Arthrobacter sp. RCC_34]|uniref:hypothetical protein n=1 Tax=Arthrobacter sp. RCC_34 TaxID=3239230 RepID=UPI0035231C12